MSRTIEVRDLRPYLTPRLVATHRNVRDAPDKELLLFFGLGKHLNVQLVENGERRTIQEGTR